jgi:hypothetical protein
MALLKDTQETYYEGGNFGTYQYISFQNIVENFIIGYVGDGKIIDNVSRTDIIFHAQRGMQELNYDVLKSQKAIEVTLNTATLAIPIPQDYVNYISVNYIDDSGVKRPIQKTRLSSNASFLPIQDENFGFIYTSDGKVVEASDSVAEQRFKEATKEDIIEQDKLNFDVDQDLYGQLNFGQRYGKEPEITMVNGFYTINYRTNSFNFSSDLSGKTIHIEYISDGIATTEEMRVNKLAEEALYKIIAYAILSNKRNVPEYIVQRYKKERRAAIRNTKIRLSNLKSIEMAQVMRGKSKRIKH